jgi:hypothetical protein
MLPGGTIPAHPTFRTRSLVPGPDLGPNAHDRKKKESATLFAGVCPALVRRGFALVVTISAAVATFPSAVTAQVLAPGGFLDTAPTTAVRATLSAAQIQGFLPARGAFTFPAPYRTTGIRLTNATDCAGSDCVDYVGYSYWRNINNHVGSDTMLVFLGLNRTQGGPGPSLFSYDKITNQVQNLGPLFDSASPFSWESGEGWYWSATQPNVLYVLQTTGSQLRRYNVSTQQFQTVFDVASQYGSDKYIWQTHSSNDDRVHSASLRQLDTWADLGCVVYREDTHQFTFYPKSNTFDECQIDKSGRYLLIKGNVTGVNGEDNVIVDLQTGTQRVLTDQQGAAGHSDNGYGHMVAADNWYSQPNTTRLWNFATNPITQSGSVVYYGTDWNEQVPAHVSWTNARADVPPQSQYACGSSAGTASIPLSNEIFCFMLDGSGHLLVVAPVMTNLNASGGGSDDYAKLPKGNLDITGQYFIWTSNLGGNRLDAFIVRVPSDLLTSLSNGDTTAPTVSLTAPASAATVSGTVTVSASASDNVGVVGVQFKLDGVNLGAEDTTSSYAVSWNTATAVNGTHTLTAVARDAAGNVRTSAARTVTVSNAGDSMSPTVSLSAPASGATVSGAVTVSASASDNVGVVGVQFKLDGVNLGAEDTTSPYAVSWSTVTAVNGTHTLTAVARDAAGRSTTSAARTVTVSNAGDGASPTVSLSAPASGATVSGAVLVSASASDNVGVVGVQFKLDGVNLGAEDTTSPYSVSWYTPGAANGTHTLTAVARDASGRTTISAARTVTVSNGVSQSVVWVSQVHATATGNSLQKTSGCDGCLDAGAISQQRISKGDGSVSFTASETAALRFAGLSVGNLGTGAGEIAFAIRLQGGYAEVREKGVYRADTPFVSGDRFTVRVVGGIVKYQKNGTVFYTSSVKPTYPLLVDASLASLNATITSAVMTGIK